MFFCRPDSFFFFPCCPNHLFAGRDRAAGENAVTIYFTLWRDAGPEWNWFRFAYPSYKKIQGGALRHDVFSTRSIWGGGRLIRIFRRPRFRPCHAECSAPLRRHILE